MKKIKLWLAGKLLRSGLRLLGFDPTKVVCVHNPFWNASGAKRWFQMAQRTGAAYEVTDVCVPKDMWAEWFADAPEQEPTRGR